VSRNGAHANGKVQHTSWIQVVGAVEPLIEVHEFGRFELRGPDGQPLPFETAPGKARELLAFLSAQEAGAAGKGKILGAIWPGADEDNDDGNNRLRVAATRLRTALV
jgi:two-component SAPR family response regulator